MNSYDLDSETLDIKSDLDMDLDDYGTDIIILDSYFEE